MHKEIVHDKEGFLMMNRIFQSVFRKTLVSRDGLARVSQFKFLSEFILLLAAFKFFFVIFAGIRREYCNNPWMIKSVYLSKRQHFG